MDKLTIAQSNRFWGYVNKTPGYGPHGDCWIWTKSISKLGYGRFGLNGKLEQAHRVAMMAHCGNIPDGMFVLHKCDFRSCCNPTHLFFGTQSDNMKDACNKGRLFICTYDARGEGCGTAKLTNESVAEIHKQYKQGIMQKQIAKNFGVGNMQICRIVHGKRWAHRHPKNLPPTTVIAVPIPN